MKNFGIQIKFKPILKVTWRSATWAGKDEFDNYCTVDVTDSLELRPTLERGKFEFARLVEPRVGRTLLTIDDEVSYAMLSRALAEARALNVPKPLLAGKKIPKRKK